MTRSFSRACSDMGSIMDACLVAGKRRGQASLPTPSPAATMVQYACASGETTMQFVRLWARCWHAWAAASRDRPVRRAR